MFFDGNDFNFGIPFLDEMPMQSNEVNSSKLVSSKEGFLRGNMFKDEYVPYKNMTYRQITPRTEKDKMLFEIMERDFAINDLNLYLDLHPEDSMMYETFKKYTKECMSLKDEYAKKFGPLTLDQVESKEYEWQKNPWPWDNNGGGMYV